MRFQNRGFISVLFAIFSVFLLSNVAFAAEDIVIFADEACSTCPAATDWSTCTDGKQTRINYRCSAVTNYECQAYQENIGCDIVTIDRAGLTNGFEDFDPIKVYHTALYGNIIVIWILGWLVIRSYSDKEREEWKDGNLRYSWEPR